MNQYDIRWVDIPGPAGKRPVLLLSRGDAYEYLNKFIAAEITTRCPRHSGTVDAWRS